MNLIELCSSFGNMRIRNLVWISEVSMKDEQPDQYFEILWKFRVGLRRNNLSPGNFRFQIFTIDTVKRLSSTRWNFSRWEASSNRGCLKKGSPRGGPGWSCSQITLGKVSNVSKNPLKSKILLQYFDFLINNED